MPALLGAGVMDAVTFLLGGVGVVAIIALCVIGLGTLIEDGAPSFGRNRTAGCTNSSGEHVWGQWKTRDDRYSVLKSTQRRTCDVCGWTEERSV